MESDFISCDWGTTSFRLRWVSGVDLRVIREVRENAGVKWMHAEAGAGPGRANRFGQFVGQMLEKLLAGEARPKRLIPLVISGMASSSIGWREVPYAKTPFQLGGRGLRFEMLEWSKPDGVGPTYLISGIATEHDMMRGEETEIVGLMSDPGLAAFGRRSLLILPGTHSKHVWIENHAVIDFRTFMTGELFDVLGRHSLLRASVDLEGQAGCGTAVLSDADRDAFCEGVRWVSEQGLPAGLFRVRTRSVLSQRPLANNTWFLSGLLIGAEVGSMGGESGDRPVILAAAGGMAELYSLALEVTAGPAFAWIRLPSDKVENAVVAGHAMFLRGRRIGSKA